MGLGSLSGGGVLIAGGGAGCTDCFQDDAEFVGGSVLAIGGINSVLKTGVYAAAIGGRGFIPDRQRSGPTTSECGYPDKPHYSSSSLPTLS